VHLLYLRPTYLPDFPVRFFFNTALGAVRYGELKNARTCLYHLPKNVTCSRAPKRIVLMKCNATASGWSVICHGGVGFAWAVQAVRTACFTEHMEMEQKKNSYLSAPCPTSFSLTRVGTS
jgi:hypothetical protein